ncbi:hypothetical protein CTI12_AA500520 [Artemisia annua]|uniref:aspartyl aminopeptidase n=1 Tax=Artemisia annua TaxID=35608 RepID=A0A2U1LE75_ARTAN|nr:hypothetical protein CTI12_AA500520 [Artemisia annua]
MERHTSTFKMQLDPKKDQFINKCRPICAEYYYRCLDSIVGDLLDYLNESWTRFHATVFQSLSEIKAKVCIIEIQLSYGECANIRWWIMAYMFCRDLSVAGRIIVRSGDGSFLHKLVKVKRPLLRVPTLAIHLDRQECCWRFQQMENGIKMLANTNGFMLLKIMQNRAFSVASGSKAPMMSMIGAANTSVGPSIMDRVTPMPSMVMMLCSYCKCFSMGRACRMVTTRVQLCRPLPVYIGRCSCVIVKEKSVDGLKGASLYTLYTNVMFSLSS